ncbi:MAG: PQQ-binding-like beta-propeller repeat protein, partial [Thermoplasmata archaeon]
EYNVSTTSGFFPRYTTDFSIEWYVERFWNHKGHLPFLMHDKIYIPAEHLYALDINNREVQSFNIALSRCISFSEGLIYGVDTNEWSIVCFNPTTNSIVWKYLRKNSMPFEIASGEQRVIVSYFHDGKIVCLNAVDGKAVWELNYHGYGVPGIKEGVVYISAREDTENGYSKWYFGAFSLQDGRLIWLKQLPYRICDISCPTIIDEGIILTISTYGDNPFYQSHVLFLNKSNGEIRWKTMLSGTRITSSPILRKERIFVVDYSGSVFAVSLVNGSIAWSSAIDTFCGEGPSMPNIGLLGNYVISGGNYINIFDYDGTLVWRYRPGGLVLDPILWNASSAFVVCSEYVLSIKQASSDKQDVFICKGDLKCSTILGDQNITRSLELYIHNMNFNHSITNYTIQVVVWIKNENRKSLVFNDFINLSEDGLNIVSFYLNLTNGTYTFNCKVTPINFNDTIQFNNEVIVDIPLHEEEPYTPNTCTSILLFTTVFLMFPLSHRIKA